MTCLTLTAPKNNRTDEQMLAAWGVPEHSIDAVLHGGAAVDTLTVPPVADVFDYAKAASRKQCAHNALLLLGKVLLHSQHPMTEVRGMLLPHLQAIDPEPNHDWLDLDRRARSLPDTGTRGLLPHLRFAPAA